MRIKEREMQGFDELAIGTVFELDNGEFCIKTGHTKPTTEYNSFNLTCNKKMHIESDYMVFVYPNATLSLN